MKNKISNQYQTLAAQLGDAYFKLSLLEKQIKELESQISALNLITPSLLKNEETNE